MKANKAQKLVIEKEIKFFFGSVWKAKKIAKEKYESAQKDFLTWRRLPKRKKIQTLPPSILDSFVKINDVDFLYYSKSKGQLSAPDGKGYYVRLKTKCGVIDYKI